MPRAMIKAVYSFLPVFPAQRFSSSFKKQIHRHLLLSIPIYFICAWQNSQSVRKMSSMNNKKPFTVFVEGNIGSGKTTFLEHFSKNDNFTVYAEPVNKWRDIQGHNLLALMYQDSSRWSFTFQSMVQKTTLEVHLHQPSTRIKMMERSMHSARHVFVDNLLQSGSMPPVEHAVIDSWYQFITSQLDVSGDLIVYLRTSPEVADMRIKQRHRPEEESIPLKYLKTLHELHDQWLLDKTHGACQEKVIVIDANKSRADMLQEFIKCEQLIESLASAQLHSTSHDVTEQVLSSPSKTILDVA